MNLFKSILFYSIWICSVFYSEICFAQNVDEIYKKKLLNGGREWRSVGMRLKLSGNTPKCEKGEYLAFEKERIIHRACNEVGTWDTTIINWHLEIGKAHQVYIYLNTTKYELFMDEPDGFYRLRLLTTRKTKFKAEPLIEFTFVTEKRHKK